MAQDKRGVSLQPGDCRKDGLQSEYAVIGDYRKIRGQPTFRKDPVRCGAGSEAGLGMERKRGYVHDSDRSRACIG